MQQMTIIRFLTLKGLKAKAIQAELESMYGKDACKLFMVKKWRLVFCKGKQLYLMLRGLADPSRKILLKQSSR
jgi:hypothetical protein